MQRVVTTHLMKESERLAEASGITQEMLMEQAGKQVAEYVAGYIQKHTLAKKAFIIAGKGNNGGDAYVAARHLLAKGVAVQVLQVLAIDPTSLTKKQRRRFEARGGKIIDLDQTLPTLPTEGVILDGLFGTGFRGVVDVQSGKVIEKVNEARLPIFAIDVPSGLDASTGEVLGPTIQATVTLAIEFPKIGFFINGGYNVIGAIESLPIGLQPFTEAHPVEYQLLEEQDVTSFLPKIVRNRHKYSAGHVVGLSGFHGMAGSSLLASWACMRSGAGIVHLLHPEKYSQEFVGQPLEVVRVPYNPEDLAPIRKWLEKASSCFVGPGLGPYAKVLDTLWTALQAKKVVIDADALTWLSSNMSREIPQEAILTPHVGEMQRLLGIEKQEGLSLTFIEKCQQFATQKNTHLVLKGGPTFLFSRDIPPTILARGDPGMATAGAGDVLTGILSSLLSQKLSCLEAMFLGTYLHAVCGEYAAKEETSYCMTASSIIRMLPKAFTQMMHLPIDSQSS